MSAQKARLAICTSALRVSPLRVTRTSKISSTLATTALLRLKPMTKSSIAEGETIITAWLMPL
ncbi:hypothetical protein D3C71_2035610 [compost metagenome]